MIIALLLLTGLVALYFGAEWLVRGGASLAVRLGVTPLLVGLTVVAYGTSTPELIVSSVAAAKGQGAIAIGNVVGSNIFNIGVILGLTALICPMRVQLQLLKFDTPVMVGVALLFLVFFLDEHIQLWEALVFLGAPWATAKPLWRNWSAAQRSPTPPCGGWAAIRGLPSSGTSRVFRRS